MNKLYFMLIAVLMSLLLSGCPGKNGSSAPPPSAFTATAEDGRVKLTWIASPGVEYWLFTSTDPSLTTTNWSGLANAHGYTSIVAPFYMCSIFSGTPYYFTANGRIDSGPGGPGSPTISATPYNASSTWIASATLPSSQNLYGVGYTGLTTCSNNSNSATGSFAAVGATGTILTSNDGQIWNSNTSPISTDLYAVTGHTTNLNNPANPGLRWVAVGAGGASVYSLDGVSWTAGNLFNSYSSANPSNQSLRDLTQVSGTFFAAGDAGTILSSTDGITWASHTSGTTNNLRGITHGSIYVAVGDSGTILTSSDGNTWTPHTSGTTNILRHVTSIGSIIVAVGDSGTIVTSKDGGTTWTSQALPGTPNLVADTAEPHFVINAVADPLLGFISNAQFVAVDSSGNAYTSTNGLIWSTAITTGITSMNTLVSSGFGYVAAGNAGATAYAF